jgi:hypothetical protein
LSASWFAGVSGRADRNFEWAVLCSLKRRYSDLGNVPGLVTGLLSRRCVYDLTCGIA